MKRPVVEEGDAFKTVYLSKAPPSFKHEDLEKALENHVYRMRRELQRDGKMVTKTIKTIKGIDGDVLLTMHWVVLGVKRTKEFRRNASGLGTFEGVAEEPGRAPIQEDSPPEPVPL